MQREIEKMKEQENSSLWQLTTPEFWPKQKNPGRKFLRG
jgi:hypothetical protein